MLANACDDNKTISKSLVNCPSVRWLSKRGFKKKTSLAHQEARKIIRSFIMKNVFKSNGPTLFKQWNSTDTEIVDDNDSDFLLAREFVAGEGVAARSMDNELSITHHDFKNRSQSGINSEFDDFGFNNYAPDPMADASLEDDFGITAALHFKISEHFQMLQQETSSEKALQPLLEEIAQVLSFDILSDNLTTLLKALLEEVSKAMDFCLSRAQTLTILESFQKQLQKLPIGHLEKSPGVISM